MKRNKISRSMDYIDERWIAEAASTEAVRKPVSIWTRMASIAAALAILLVGGIVLTRFIDFGSGNTVIALDVNPSIELEINDKEEVIEIRALNKDAEIVIGDMDFRRVKLDVAMNAIIGSMLQNGYLSAEQNSILISVNTKKAENADALTAAVTEKVQALLGEQSIEASVMTQVFEKNDVINKEAEENGVSAAKATLIQKILAAGLANADGIPYTKEQLAEMNINELKLLLESKKIELDGVGSEGVASDKKLIGADRALEIAYTDAEVALEDIVKLECELDFDKHTKKMIYEVDFETSETEYEYELDAVSGEILSAESEIEDDDDDDRHPQLPVESLSKDDAIQKALEKAGLARNNVTDLDCELIGKWDYIVYKVEFDYDGNEYEYTVDAKNGEILHAEIEPEDHHNNPSYRPGGQPGGNQQPGGGQQPGGNQQPGGGHGGR